MSVEQTQPLISHLLELRDRLLRSIAAVIVVFVGLIYFSNNIYEFVSRPLVDRLPEGATMIATDVASPFFTPLKLTLIVAVFLSVPFILYQVWAFVAPGLYKHERRLIFPLLVSSSLLFYCGVAFCLLRGVPVGVWVLYRDIAWRRRVCYRHCQLSRFRTGAVYGVWYCV